jgi:HEPN domain-containing protein
MLLDGGSIMLERSLDWLRQAEADLRHARNARDDRDYYTRCPYGFEPGGPVDFYTRREAEHAITNAEAILDWCRRQIGR